MAYFRVLIQNYTVNLSQNLDLHSSKYENVFVIGDFNAEMTNNYLEEYCSSYNLKNLIKQPNWIKNLENSTCIDYLLTNDPWMNINGFKRFSGKA